VLHSRKSDLHRAKKRQAVRKDSAMVNEMALPTADLLEFQWSDFQAGFTAAPVVGHAMGALKSGHERFGTIVLVFLQRFRSPPPNNIKGLQVILYRGDPRVAEG
jgi:hypothetical protein